MDYEFPVIQNFQDVWPHVEDEPEFICKETDDHLIINYVVSYVDTFPSPPLLLSDKIRRECRGIVFDKKSGDVVSRRFHKFFNLGEEQSKAADFSKPHVILEKLDGSMVTPLVYPDETIRWGTKMGITDTSMQAESWLVESGNWDKYEQFAKSCYGANITPIFEWISPDNQIVVPYKEPNLVLLALRMNIKGTYFDRPLMEYVATTRFNIPLVKTRTSLPDTAVDTDEEGVVVQFEDGHMVKVKTQWYVDLHRIKDRISTPRRLWQVILNNEADDLLACADASVKQKIEEESVKVHEFVSTLVENIQVSSTYYKDRGYSRKQFALGPAEKLKPIERAGVFYLFDNSEDKAKEFVLKTVLKNCSSEKAFQKMVGE